MAHVIVVEDEQVVREVFSVWLENDGHAVQSAASSEEAQVLLQASTTDVLLTDIRLARATTGIDLLAWAKQFDPNIAVVLITGAPAVQTAVDALRLNAYDYLLKPVPEPALLQAVKRAASHSLLLREKLQLEQENRRYQRHLEELVTQRTTALQRRTKQLVLLHEVSTAISALQNLSDLYRQVVTLMHDTLGYLNASIYQVDTLNKCLTLQATAGVRPAALPTGFQQPISRGLLGLTAQEGRSIVANDVSLWSESVGCEGSDTCSQAVYPILVDGEVMFVLEVTEDRLEAFDETDSIVLQTLADHIGVALANVGLYDRLRKALTMREQILQNISHELRTPLTLISGYAEFLIENLPPDAPELTTELANTIVEQTQHLGHLVNQLIMFQTIDRETMPLDLLDMSLWLQNIADIWAPILAQSGLVLRTGIEAGLGYVFGNWSYLTQVMQNLLDNARKFSPERGTVEIRAWRAGHQIHTSVSDQGIGVDPDKLPYLFDRFYQAEAGVTRRFGGMGLGLALVREIIAQHKGSLSADSSGQGKGLSISFSLPAAD